MVNKKLKKAAWYFAAFMAVCFGMEWGYSYILAAHEKRRSKKLKAAGSSLQGAS
jgi:hypothetical protein